MNGKLIWLCVVLSLAEFSGAAATENLTAYHIGNSLTRGLPKELLATWASLRGHSYHAGQHVQNGARLDEIWQKRIPTELPIAAFGSFYDELPSGRFDALTLEPYFDQLDVAAERITDFRSLAMNTDQIYVYQVWPRSSYGDYQTIWDAPWDDGPSHLFTREFYRRLLNKLPADTQIIPTGEVLYEVAGLIATNSLPEIATMEDLYALDNCTCHLNDVGNFVLASTVYATLFKESPVGLPAFVDVTPDTAKLIQSVAWQVVTKHPQTGVEPTTAPEPSAIIMMLGIFIAAAQGLRPFRGIYSTRSNCFCSMCADGTVITS